MKASVVIGAQYGDEGKGLTVDWLAGRTERPIVVRFNGGAQAGHTVVRPDGVRHIHQHFGSGTLAEAATVLSRFFIVNPITFRREHDELVEKGITPDIYIDEQALVTTPYDMMLNQAVEVQRGAGRHGSCGLGINETIVRTNAGFIVEARDLSNLPRMQKVLQRIRTEWMPIRMKALGLPDLVCPERLNDLVLDRFCVDSFSVTQNAMVLPWFDMTGKNLIFEGAQGLRLDEMAAGFPHVTRSRTGLTNVLSLAREWGITQLDTHYVTRCYVTRHGAGPLSHEVDTPPYPGIVDHTNIENPWQGRLRYGLFDVDEFTDAVLGDLRAHPFPGQHSVVVTCFDQLRGQDVVMRSRYGRAVIHPEAFGNLLRERIGARRSVESYGPTRADVRVFNRSIANVG